MEVIRDTYYHRPAPGARLIRLGRNRKEAQAALAEWRKHQRAEKMRSVDPWLTVQRNLYFSMKKRCMERGWVPLNKEEIERLWVRAAGRCELTGIPFSLSREPGHNRRPWAPSLDRRDCAQPYVWDNCRLVCNSVNIALNEWGEDVLLRIAKALVRR